MDSEVAAHRLSCPESCGIILDQESNPCPLTTRPPGKSPWVNIDYHVYLCQDARSLSSAAFVSSISYAEGAADKHWFQFSDGKMQI